MLSSVLWFHTLNIARIFHFLQVHSSYVWPNRFNTTERSVQFIHLQAPFILCGPTALVGARPPHCSCPNFTNTLTHTHTHIHTHIHTHTRQDSSERVISPSQRPLPTKHTTKVTNILTLGGIRTRDPSNWAAAGLCLRRQGHRDQLTGILLPYYYSNVAEFLASRVTNNEYTRWFKYDRDWFVCK